MANEKYIWDFLRNKGLTEYAVAGIMGNLQAESGMQTNNLEDTRNKELGISDSEYTKRVDNSTISRSGFINDYCGYGLAQWTDSSRKAGLYDLCKLNNKSISDINCQLNYLYQELTNYGLVSSMNNATSIQDASTIFLKKFEIPLDSGPGVQAYRASLAQSWYNQFHGSK